MQMTHSVDTSQASTMHTVLAGEHRTAVVAAAYSTNFSFFPNFQAVTKFSCPKFLFHTY